MSHERGAAGGCLPPGQHLVDGFPRFGVQLARPAPRIPAHPVIKIRGAVTQQFDLPLAALATLPRRELTADFHCVAGWSATNLRWEGVGFETFYRTIIEPLLGLGTSITHVVFGGLDGYRSAMSIDDALAEEVLIAEHLEGRPLDADHVAPAATVHVEAGCRDSVLLVECGGLNRAEASCDVRSM